LFLAGTHANDPRSVPAPDGNGRPKRVEFRGMRIVYLNPVGVLGGAERCLLYLMTAVRQAEPKAELQLLVLTDGPLIHLAENLGVRTRLVPMPEEMAVVGDSSLNGGRRRGGAWLPWSQALPAVPATLQYVTRLRKVLEDVKPSLIHSNGMKTHALTR